MMTAVKPVQVMKVDGGVWLSCTKTERVRKVSRMAERKMSIYE